MNTYAAYKTIMCMRDTPCQELFVRARRQAAPQLTSMSPPTCADHACIVVLRDHGAASTWSERADHLCYRNLMHTNGVRVFVLPSLRR